MTLTCYCCPRFIAFPGRERDLWAARFGWVVQSGRYYCTKCGKPGA